MIASLLLSFFLTAVPCMTGHADTAGQLLITEFADEISANPEAAAIIDKIKSSGRPLPELVVRRDKSVFMAWFSDSDWTITINAAYLSSYLGRKKSATPAELTKILADRPKVRQFFIQSADYLIYHELVHVSQLLSYPDMKKPDTQAWPIDFEYEAYIRQNIFLHEKLKATPSILRKFMRSQHHDIYLESAFANYLALALDIDKYRQAIKDKYAKNAATEYYSLDASSGTAAADFKSFVDNFTSLRWPDLSREALLMLGKEALPAQNYPVALQCFLAAEKSAEHFALPEETITEMKKETALAILSASDFLRDNRKSLRLIDRGMILIALDKVMEGTGQPFPERFMKMRADTYPKLLTAYRRLAAKTPYPDLRDRYNEDGDFMEARIAAGL